jgi:predicted amidophosphoribosyltransferase
MIHCVIDKKMYRAIDTSANFREKKEESMATCTQCGFDVSGKKFCPECGTPVQAAPQVEPATASCPTCGGTVRTNAAFCMHCGKSLGAQAMAAVSAPVTVAPRPVQRLCPACHQEVPASSAFCTNCGQSIQVTATPAPAAPSQSFCGNCGASNAAGARFCNSCGQNIAPAAATGYPQTGPYQQPSQYTPQPQYQQPSQYPPQQQYPQQYPQQQYGQPQYNAGYAQQQYPQQAPMLGQQPMVLRCPVCMAMAPQGTAACPSCHTSLAGVVPTPSVQPVQGQQQGGLGGFLQGKGGNMAMGALGGAAAVIGGEMLLHGVERGIEGDMDRRRGYDDYGDRDRGGGMLGELGNLGNDIGLF